MGQVRQGLKSRLCHCVSAGLLICHTSLTIQLFFCKMKIVVGISLTCHLNKITRVDGPVHGMGSVHWVPLPRPNIIIPWGCDNKVPQLGYLRTRETYKFIFSQFWRPQVQNHGVGRVMLSLKALGRICSGPLSQLLVVAGNPWHSLACGSIISISVSIAHALPFCVFLCSNFSFFVKTQVIRLGPTLLLCDLI